MEKKKILISLTIFAIIIFTALTIFISYNNRKIESKPEDINWVTLEFESWKDLDAYFESINYDLDNPEIPNVLIKSFPKDFPDVYPVEKKKELFTKIMLPIILAINAEIENEQIKLDKALIENDLETIENLKAKYNATNIEELKIRIKPIPIEIALGQSAKESGWGSSRFAIEGNNIFGEWTWEPGTGIVPAERAEGEIYEVKKFESLTDSMRSYALKLNSLNYYEDFRLIRAGIIKNKSYEDGLLYYSQQRELYVSTLKDLIDSNNFREFSSMNFELYYIEN